jgi:anti-sigma regulatory factor (Ser/Thr protein kinase)
VDQIVAAGITHFIDMRAEFDDDTLNDGNRLNARKLVHIRCRCRVGYGISLVVSDQGEGFDARTVHDPLAAGNLVAEHGRGIQLMKSAMDLVSFERRGTAVHMRKRPVRNPSDARSDSRRC